jgi:soluble lytic murein transglycosylase-like protein
MNSTLFRALVAAVLMVAAVPGAASAQIYAWRDGAGNWVLSSDKKDPSARTYAVAGESTFRTTRPANFNRRASEYEGLIFEHATAQGVSPDLVRAVIQQESAFNPRAVSVKGAMGLMQLMPATAKAHGVLDPFNPAQNIRAGVAYLKNLLVKFSQNVELALAAYNAGPRAVTRYGAVPPYRETRNYVTKIMDAAPKPVPIYRSVEIVNGRRVTRYSTVETPGAQLVTTFTKR